MIKTAGILTIIPSIPSAVFVPYTERAAGAVNGWIPKGENPLDQMRKFLNGLKLNKFFSHDYSCRYFECKTLAIAFR